MKATVDREACISCGLCATLCPNVFEMDEESIAIVKVEDIAPEDEADAQNATDSCPVSAIALEC